MRKIFLLAFFVVLSVLIISCLPPTGESGEKTALAGLAISKGCYDADNDGYGRSGKSIVACSGSTRIFDCNDNNAAINPGVREICGNRLDDNCNRKTDEAGCVAACTPTTEICDNIDNDCDLQVDLGCDDDNDDFCDISMNLSTYLYADCRAGTNCCQSYPIHYDCDDTNSAIGPLTAEICDGVDNDCDGVVDEVCPVCTDSDGNIIGGEIYLVGGHTSTVEIGRETIHYDTCVNSTHLRERLCISQNIRSPETSQDVSCADYTPFSTCIDPDGSGPTPAYCGSTSTSTCGNGLLESGEICDDGNTINGDSCSQCTCADSDGSSSNYNDVGGNVTTLDAFGRTVVNYDYCDAEGTDLFEYRCDNTGMYAIDYSCAASGAGFRCIDSNGVGWPSGYCGR